MARNKRRDKRPDQVKLAAKEVAAVQDALNIPGERISDRYDERDLIVRNSKTAEEFESVADKFLAERLGNKEQQVPEQQVEQQVPQKPPVTQEQLESSLDLESLESELLGKNDAPVIEDQVEAVQDTVQVDQPVIPEIPEVPEDVVAELPEVPQPPVIEEIDGHDVHYWHHRFLTIQGQHRSLSEQHKQLKELHENQTEQITALKSEIRNLKINQPVTDADLLAMGYNEDQIEFHGDVLRNTVKNQRQSQYDMENYRNEQERELERLRKEFSTKQTQAVDPEVKRQQEVHSLLEQVEILSPGFLQCNRNDPEFAKWLETDMTSGFTWKSMAETAINAKDVQKLNSIYRNYLAMRSKANMAKVSSPPSVKPTAAPVKQQMVKQSQPEAEKPVRMSDFDKLTQWLTGVVTPPERYRGHAGKAILRDVYAKYQSKIARNLVIDDRQTA